MLYFYDVAYFKCRFDFVHNLDAAHLAYMVIIGKLNPHVNSLQRRVNISDGKIARLFILHLDPGAYAHDKPGITGFDDNAFVA